MLESDEELLLRVIDYCIRHPIAVPGYLQVWDMLGGQYKAPALAEEYIAWVDGGMPPSQLFTTRVRDQQAILDEISV